MLLAYDDFARMFEHVEAIDVGTIAADGELISVRDGGEYYLITDYASGAIHDDARDVEHRMAEHQVRRLPVVDEAGRVVGVVTLADLAHASQRGHDLSPRSPTWTLAAITRPRHLRRAA